MWVSGGLLVLRVGVMEVVVGVEGGGRGGEGGGWGCSRVWEWEWGCGGDCKLCSSKQG